MICVLPKVYMNKNDGKKVKHGYTCYWDVSSQVWARAISQEHFRFSSTHF